MERETIKLGLIRGRHLLPVENYIVEESQLTVFTKEELEPIIRKGILKYVDLYTLTTYSYEISCPSVEWRDKENNYIEDYKLPTVQLYITGLTIVTLIATEILINSGYNVDIIGFNPNSKKYYNQGTFKKKDIKISF